MLALRKHRSPKRGTVRCTCGRSRLMTSAVSTRPMVRSAPTASEQAATCRRRPTRLSAATLGNVLDFFGTRWEDVTVETVEAFLAGAGY